MLPAPVGDVGETARWFREDLTLLADRLLRAGGASGEGEAEAFRDFFLALQVDADPAEVRASLLRFAGTFFARGALLEIRDGGLRVGGRLRLRVSEPGARLARHGAAGGRRRRAQGGAARPPTRRRARRDRRRSSCARAGWTAPRFFPVLRRAASAWRSSSATGRSWRPGEAGGAGRRAGAAAAPSSASPRSGDRASLRSDGAPARPRRTAWPRLRPAVPTPAPRHLCATIREWPSRTIRNRSSRAGRSTGRGSASPRWTPRRRRTSTC